MKHILTILCLLLVAGCQSVSPTAVVVPSASAAAALPSLVPTSSPTLTPTASPSPEPTSGPVSTPFPFRSAAPDEFGSPALASASRAAYPPGLEQLPIEDAQITNPQVLYGLTTEQRAFLLRNGFVAIPSREESFKLIRRAVSSRDGQPYYLTTDAAYHALHVAYNDLLPALESQVLRPQLILLLQAVYAQTTVYAAHLAGGEYASDAFLARDYCAAALKLLDPSLVFEAQVAGRIAPQLDQITAAFKGQQHSALIPAYQDDFSLYRPGGHYNASPSLQAYFRGLTWLSRAVLPPRAAALLTLALRDSQAGGRLAWQVWASLHEILDYLGGPRLNPGPAELNELLGLTGAGTGGLAVLANAASWQPFLPNAQYVAPGQDTPPGASQWSFFGLHFSLEAQINLPDPAGAYLPTGLNLAAFFDSPAASQFMAASKMVLPAEYAERGTHIRAGWTQAFGSVWLYAWVAQFAPKGEQYPPSMRSLPLQGPNGSNLAWAYKDLTSALGSWAESKDDGRALVKLPPTPIAPARLPAASPPAPGYVEPQPDVFYRLAYGANALCQGLAERGLDQLAQPDLATAVPFAVAKQQLCQLGGQFDQLAAIAQKELGGDALTAEDFRAIQGCLELKECRDQGEFALNNPEPEPLPGLVQVASTGSKNLLAGTGLLNRIYVLVPLDGRMQVAQGGVYSYYEFTRSGYASLDLQDWPARLAADPPSLAEWQLKYLLPGGSPYRFLAFRAGDVYRVGLRGYSPYIPIYADPSPTAAVLTRLKSTDTFTIRAGPVLVGLQRWWQISPAPNADEFPSGWIPENQYWFVRASN